MKSRFNDRTRMNPDGSIRVLYNLLQHTTEMDDSHSAAWTRFQSITQENDLEAFLNTAQLAGTEFTAG